jgi:hypothetical protein
MPPRERQSPDWRSQASIVADRYSSRRQFLKQLRHAGCEFTVARHDHSPCEIFPERASDDAPTLQGGWRRLPDLDDGPMTSQRQCCLSIGRRTAHDEVIVAAHEDADHAASGLEPRIGNGAADGKVIDDLAREIARILARRRIFLFLLKRLPVRGMLFAGFGNHGNEIA